MGDGRRRGWRHRPLDLLLLLAVVFAACGDGSESVGRTDRRGKVVVAVDAEPATLNPFLASGSLALNAFLSDKVMVGAWRVGPDFEMVAALLAGEPVITTDPFTVTYNIRPDAVWSDGTPVTARDFEFTWRTVTDPRWQIAVREGYAEIASVEAVDPKTVRVTFREAYGHWRLLFRRGGVLPAHHLDGKNFDDVWKDAIDISNGPFMFREWVKGDHLTLVRNPRYFGARAQVDEIEIRFIPDANTAFQQFRGGDVDVFLAAPQHVRHVNDMPDATSQAAPGSSVVHLGFNVGDERLNDARVRRGIALAIDRDGLVTAAFGQEYPRVTPLHSLVYTATQDGYAPHFDAYRRDPARAAGLLDEAGCRRAPDADVRRCPGGALSLTVGVRAGDDAGRRLFEVLQAQLEEIGVMVHADFAELNTLIGKAIAGEYAMVFEGVAGAPEPVLSDLMWTCGGSLNVHRYCNQAVSDAIHQGARQLDARAAADSYNRADATMVDDPPALPVVQVPITLAWRNHVRGPQLNPAFPSPFWNAEEWSVAS